MVVIGRVAAVPVRAARLRELLRGDGGGGGIVPLAAFGGAVLFGADCCSSGVVHFALVQAADHRFADAGQTLNVLDNDDFLS